MKNKNLLWRMISFDTALLVILMDQLCKWLVMTNVFETIYQDDVPDFLSWLFTKGRELPNAATIKVTEFFNMVMVWNPGVSFGMLQIAQISLVLSAVAVLVVVGFFIWMWREPRATLAFPVGLLTGGALANVWDRLRFGAVADFFDFHVGSYHWPAFNLADAAITIGVILLLIDQLVLSKPSVHGAVLNEKL